MKINLCLFVKAMTGLLLVVFLSQPAATEPPVVAVVAVDFESQVVYRSQRPPGYAAWVSFFPGENGQWYIGCEEVSRPEQPLPQTSPESWFGMGLPMGYDKSQYLMEAVVLESTDNLETWQVISRFPYRQQHTVGQFGMARTKDGRFLRFNWACYALDPTVKTNEILSESADNGKTWSKVRPFVTDRFAYYPHRLRTLSDGTLVLCTPIAPRWGKGTDRPVRTSKRLDTDREMRMSLFFSFDEGRTWDGPLPIYGGTYASETDFVELPDGNLLFFNNSIFPQPGRQFVYRDGNRFVPGPLEKVRRGRVPETVCLLEEGLLVGCDRPGSYHWSDDWGQTWQRLAGIPKQGPEVYQPWIRLLPDGRVACTGHYGADNAIDAGRTFENYINLHTFRLQVNHQTKDTKIWVERDYDENQRRWLNSFSVQLTQEGEPLEDKRLEFWYVERYKPGYDSYHATSLAERMKAGGTLLHPKTDAKGRAHVRLPDRFDKITNPHLCYQLVVRFNMDGGDLDYKPFQTPQFTFYALAPLPPKLETTDN
ncbi:MAG: hypothetical protein CMJ81_22505 [Planctomycetaceae bacterium]|nr:hypothetical protein [Planctomycetaceae bacterium]